MKKQYRDLLDILEPAKNQKYPNVYKLVRDLNLETRADKRPIDCMIKYRRRRNMEKGIEQFVADSAL